MDREEKKVRSDNERRKEIKKVEDMIMENASS